MGNTLVVATHDGNFHADECLAIATLRKLFGKEKIRVIRTRDQKLLASADMRVDVGGKFNPLTNDYDHHQKEGAGCRQNGIPYSSFGLVWNNFGEKVCKDINVSKIVDSAIVQQVDAEDNGFSLYEKTSPVTPFTISAIFANLVPKWHEKKDYDAAFENAVDLAEQVIERAIVKAEAIVKTKELVSKAIAEAIDHRVIVLNSDCPWQSQVMNYSEAILFVVYPAANEMWRVKCVPKGEKNFFEVRKLLPAAWAGKNTEELAYLTGVEDALFCHPKRFVAGAISKSGALRLAQIAIDERQGG